MNTAKPPDLILAIVCRETWPPVEKPYPYPRRQSTPPKPRPWLSYEIFMVNRGDVPLDIQYNTGGFCSGFGDALLQTSVSSDAAHVEPRTAALVETTDDGAFDFTFFSAATARSPSGSRCRSRTFTLSRNPSRIAPRSLSNPWRPLRILEQVHIRPSDRVIVLGPGRLGQLCARVLALTGARVQVRGRPERLARLPKGIEHGGESGADVVIDCPGSSIGLGLAVSLVRPEGTVILKTTTHDLAGFEPNNVVINEVRVIGSRCGPFEPALRLLASGAVDPTGLIDAELPLGVEALNRARGAMKVVMRG